MKSDKLKPPPQFKTVAQRITQLSDPIYMGETAQAAAVFDEYQVAKKLLAKWKATDPRGIPSEVALRDEQLAQAQHNFDAIEEKFRTFRGDFGESPEVVPAPLPGTSGATVAAKPVSKNASVTNNSKRGTVLKRSAMVKKLATVWQGISSDLQHSDKNGLAKAAKASGHGNWYEDDALTWAKQRGKVGDPPATKNAANSIFDLPGERHLIEG